MPGFKACIPTGESSSEANYNVRPDELEPMLIHILVLGHVGI